MLSGIGDKNELAQHGIKCVHNLKGVGKNLQDHLFCSVGASAKVQAGLNQHIPIFNQIKAAWSYFVSNKGPFTIGPLEGMAFLDIHKNNAPANHQLHFAPMWIGKGYDYDLYDINTYPTVDGFTILPTLLHPKSRGYVGLRSADPKDSPLVQPNFLQEKQDLDELVKGVKLAVEIFQQDAFKDLLKELASPPDTSSDGALMQHIKKSLETVYHPVGTCKMGSDDMAVVDSQLRVHGVAGLRVVDASIMPKIVSGNTNAPTFMIAEKAADMVLGNIPASKKEKQKSIS